MYVEYIQTTLRDARQSKSREARRACGRFLMLGNATRPQRRLMNLIFLMNVTNKADARDPRPGANAFYGDQHELVHSNPTLSDHPLRGWAIANLNIFLRLGEVTDEGSRQI